MTGRVVLGVIMLERRSLLSAVVMVAFTSRIESAGTWLTGGAIMLLAGGAGLSATNVLSSRTLSVLPLDTRDITRATWVLTAGLPFLLLTAGRAVSASIFAPFGDQWTWVFPATPVRVFYEGLFFAMEGAWNVLVPDSDAPDYRKDSGLYLFVLGLLGVMVVPFVVLYFLPATFAGISLVGWLLTGVAIVLATTPLFLPPKQHVRLEAQRVAPNVEPTKTVAAGAVAVSEAAPRLKGLWALLPGVLARAAAWAVVFVTFQLMIAWTIGTEVILQPFAPGMPGMQFLLGTSFLLLLVMGLLPGLGERLPVLKLLPSSPRRVAAAMTLAPTSTPLLFWTALVLIHAAVSADWPQTLRLDYLTLLVGTAALTDAVGIKSGSATAKLAIGTPLILGLAFALDGDRTSVERLLHHWLVPASGVAALGLAYILNLHTVTRSQRSSRAYRFGRTGSPQGAR